jgi:hypothetical protein
MEGLASGAAAGLVPGITDVYSVTQKKSGFDPVSGYLYGSYKGAKKEAQREAAYQDKQYRQAEKLALQAEAAQAQQFNRANQRRASLLDLGADFGGGTMLTGPQGVTEGMTLGRKSLLGR